MTWTRRCASATAIAMRCDGQVIQQDTGQDIVLRIGDDQVSNFVQHVDRDKVVQVASVMEPASPVGAIKGAVVADDVTLNDAVRRMMAHGVQWLDVQHKGGKPVCRLSLEGVIFVAAGAA